MSVRKAIGFIFIGVFLISCNEDFNPYGDYIEKYAFTCILKSNENFQTATLFKSYRPDGYDPYTYTTDPSIVGADIRVWYNDTVFVFSDSSVTREDTSRYKTPFSFYYNNKFFVGNRKTIELEVLLPNGKRLRSSSFTPGQITFDNNSEVIIPPIGKNIVQVIWKTLDEGTFFLPRLAIRYEQKINGEVVYKEKDIPTRYVTQGNELTPVYPVPNASITVVYQMDAVIKALQEISDTDPNKDNYAVFQNLLFSCIAFDQPSSRYLSSTGGNVDDLTVSVDVADYSNIEGGFGLFGSYSQKNYTRLRFLQDYIESFGYNFIVEN
jgi:hypothetical protein